MDSTVTAPAGPGPAGATPDGRTLAAQHRLGTAARLGVRVAHWVGKGLFGVLYRVDTPGRGLVPASGPVILAVNHTAFLDGPLVVGVTPRPVHVLSKAELFHGALGALLRLIGQIPVRRDTADLAALGAGLDVLGRGGVLAVFPEGSRGKGDFSDMRDGLAWLAMRSQAPIVPVVCVGTGAGGSTISSVARPGSRLVAAYGAPFTVPVPVDRPRSRRALTAGSELVRDRLVAHHRVVHTRFGADS